MRVISTSLKAAVSALICAVAVIPLVILIETITSSRPPDAFSFGGPFDETSPNAVGSYSAVRHGGVEDETSCRTTPDLIVVYAVLERLDVTNGIADVDISFCLGGSVARLLDEHPDWRPAISVRGATSILSGPLVVATTTDVAVQHLGSVGLSVDGDSRTYPLDFYRGSLLVMITTPSEPNPSQLYRVPVLIEPTSDHQASAFDWGASQTLTNDFVNPHPGGHYISYTVMPIQARRPIRTTGLFVLTLVAVPAILIIVLAGRLATTTGRSVETLAGVAAILLAILPIRLVLVPAEITSLTLVDLALGSEMAALAAGTALVYLWGGWGRFTPEHVPGLAATQRDTPKGGPPAGKSDAER